MGPSAGTGCIGVLCSAQKYSAHHLRGTSGPGVRFLVPAPLLLVAWVELLPLWGGGARRDPGTAPTLPQSLKYTAKASSKSPRPHFLFRFFKTNFSGWGLAGVGKSLGYGDAHPSVPFVGNLQPAAGLWWFMEESGRTAPAF